MSTNSQRLDDITRELDAAVSNAAAIHLTGGPASFDDSRHLRYADAGDDAGRADGTGADTDLDAVGTSLENGFGSFIGSYVAGNELALGEGSFHFLDGAQHVCRMPVRGVEDEDISSALQKLLGTIDGVAGHTDGGGNAQTAAIVLAGIGIFLHFVDVLHGDKAAQMFVLVDNQQLFDTVLVQMTLGFLKRNAHGHRDEILAGHDVAHADGISILNKADIPVGDNALQGTVVHNRKTGNPEIMHQGKGFTDRAFGANGHGVKNHAAFAFLDTLDLESLLGDGHILMDNTDTTHAGHGNGHGGLGHRIHSRREQRNAQLYLRSQPCGDINHVRGNFRVAGNKQNVVKGQSLASIRKHVRLSLLRWTLVKKIELVLIYWATLLVNKPQAFTCHAVILSGKQKFFRNTERHSDP